LYGEDDKELDEMLNKMESISRQGGGWLIFKQKPHYKIPPILDKPLFKRLFKIRLPLGERNCH